MGVRCFIAVNLDEALKQEIEKATSGLRAGKYDVRWVPAQNLHITLKFLGDTREDLLHKIEKKLLEVSSSHMAFNAKLYSIGVFPSNRNPRVVWLDIPDADSLIKLQVIIEESMVSLGFIKEIRPFYPHLTIGRIRSLRGRDSLLKAIETLKDCDFGNIEVNKVSLMKSEVKPSGAEYMPLAEFDLKRSQIAT